MMNGNDLIALGYKEGKILGLALAALPAMMQLSKKQSIACLRK